MFSTSRLLKNKKEPLRQRRMSLRLRIHTDERRMKFTRNAFLKHFLTSIRDNLCNPWFILLNKDFFINLLERYPNQLLVFLGHSRKIFHITMICKRERREGVRASMLRHSACYLSEGIFGEELLNKRKQDVIFFMDVVDKELDNSL